MLLCRLGNVEVHLDDLAERNTFLEVAILIKLVEELTYLENVMMLNLHLAKRALNIQSDELAVAVQHAVEIILDLIEGRGLLNSLCRNTCDLASVESGLDPVADKCVEHNLTPDVHDADPDLVNFGSCLLAHDHRHVLFVDQFRRDPHDRSWPNKFSVQ